MPGDVYTAADDLVVRLRADGADRWADGINEAIDAGSTGTEILMALRHQLAGLLDANEASSKARELAAALMTELDGLLEG